MRLVATTILLLFVMSLSLGEAQAQKDTVSGIRFYKEGEKRVKVWNLFYHDHMDGSAVRLRNMSLDSLPDEIVLKLIEDTTQFCFPMKNIITSPYGWRERWHRPHRGVDILLRTGDPVRACFPGVVRIARSVGGYGCCVVLRHENGLETLYGHMSKLLVKPHQIVNAGDIVGLGGSTGHSTGPHLHFEVRFQYEPFDPEWILDFKTYKLRTRKLHLDKTYFGISRPQGKKPQAFKADKSIIKETFDKPKGPKELYYTARKGDTFRTIAEMYHTDEFKLRDLNPKIKKIKTGTRIRVR
ncbi:MAG: peptidoglycan DD-metalloendopeptidase family protein [Bacteroidales bacterium]|nr:peptidoglycan DD-metalloendopeptidase family protein [Bacteroidales bacterium]